MRLASISYCLLAILSASPALGEALSPNSELRSSASTLSSKVWGNSPVAQRNFFTGIETPQSLKTHLGIEESIRDLDNILTPEFGRRKGNYFPSVSSEKLPIFNMTFETHRQVNDTPAGALIKEGRDLAGSRPSDDPNEKLGITTNNVVNKFFKKFPNLVKSVGGLYEFTNNQAIPRGTAFLIREDLIATARHVVAGLRKDSESGTPLDAAQVITRPNVYLIFNVTYEKYQKIKGGLSSYSPSTDADAVKLSDSAIAHWHKAADVATISIPQNSSRQILVRSSKRVVSNEELVIIGVPATKDFHLDEDKLQQKNYEVYGLLPTANSDLGPIPILWFTSGKFLEDEDIYARRLRLDINALRGNSGSPIFRASDAQVVGILVDADIARETSDGHAFNTAANVSSLDDLLKQLVSSVSQ